jgi:hypothetical protein
MFLDKLFLTYSKLQYRTGHSTIMQETVQAAADKGRQAVERGQETIRGVAAQGQVLYHIFLYQLLALFSRCSVVFPLFYDPASRLCCQGQGAGDGGARPGNRQDRCSPGTGNHPMHPSASLHI